jgi:MHS family alpha-ketoglutarate permease-like MFS transporter
VSLYTATVAVGTLTGSIVGVALSWSLAPDAIKDWGWRIPFIIGGALGILGLIIRRHLHETLEPSAKPPAQPIRTVWREYRPAALLTFLLIGSVAMTFFALVAGFPALASLLGAKDDDAYQANALALILMIALVPVFGRLSDRVGRRPVLIAGLAGVAVLVIPALLLLQGATTPWRVFAAQLIVIVPVAATQGPLISTMVERFPANLRGVGFGLFYALGTAVFGGTAPMISSWLNGEGDPVAFGAYVAVFAVIAALVLWRAPESANRPMQQ